LRVCNARALLVVPAPCLNPPLGIVSLLSGNAAADTPAREAKG
jgi:hypothetical protein